MLHPHLDCLRRRSHQIGVHDHALELAHIPRILSLPEPDRRAVLEARRARDLRFLGVAVEKALRQQRDLGPPLRQRRHTDAAHPKPIPQVLEQHAASHQLVGIVRHRQNDPAPDREYTIRPHRTVRPAIEDLKQLLLHAEFEILHIIEQQRPVAGRRYAARPHSARVGVGALDVAE